MSGAILYLLPTVMHIPRKIEISIKSNEVSTIRWLEPFTWTFQKNLCFKVGKLNETYSNRKAPVFDHAFRGTEPRRTCFQNGRYHLYYQYRMLPALMVGHIQTAKNAMVKMALVW